MQVYRTGRAKTVALVAINLLLGLLIAMEIYFTLAPSADEKVKEPVQPKAELIIPPPSAIAMHPFEHYAETLERPLFSYDRRPHDGAVEDASDIELLRLLGIVITSDKTEALFLSISGKEVVHGLIGEEVEGWEIASIQADGVTLSRGGKIKEMKLERASQLPASESIKRMRKNR